MQNGQSQQSLQDKYGVIIASLIPTQTEQHILAAVKAGISSDNARSPWSQERWYHGFTQRNSDYLTFKDAPKNKLLMVVTEKLGTLYARDRGSSIMRGSIFVKLEDNLVYCIDSMAWYASPSGSALVYPHNGFYELNKPGVYGEVKELRNVKP